jgi:acyl-CoA synthetase (AMP-forming)/AMP-acid ligase II/acyl carrier protein
MCFEITGSVKRCTTLVEVLRARAELQPDRVGYVFLLDGERKEIQLTYGELDRQARAIAARLQDAGATGERALLLFQPGLDYIAAFFGCLYAGVTAVPAFPPRPNRPMPRLQGIVADAQIKLALTTAALMKNIEGRFSDCPDLRALCWLTSDELPAGLESGWREPDVGPDSLAFLQYTSGSTATPKGVMLSHANLMHNLASITRLFEPTPDCRGTFWLPPYHDMGLIGGILEPLHVGFPAMLMSPAAFLQSPFRWLDAISRFRAVFSGGPNFAYDLCVSKITAEQRARLDLRSWALAFNGAEPVRAETMERFSATFAPCGFRREALYPCYGLAESTLLVTGSARSALPVMLRVDAPALAGNQVRPVSSEARAARTLVASGRCPPGQRLRIVDPQTRVPCPADQVGEIWVQGPSVARGYWNRPEETDQVFAARLAGTDEGPFLRTGDLGFVKGGELFVTGRVKDLIILHGKNHYPQDIELTAEESTPAVRPGCAAAFAVERGGAERLVIVAEVERDRRHQDLDSTLAVMRRAVAAHHDVPVWNIILIKTLTIPKTSSGKIRRQECRQRFLDKQLDVVAQWTQPDESHADALAEIDDTVTAQTPASCARPTAQAIQEWLAGQIADRLHMPAAEVNVGEPFARLGMDSMTAVLLAGDLEVWLGRQVSPTLMYDFPSIEELARHLALEPAVQIDPATEPPVYAGALDGAGAEGLLARLADMSDEEAGALLQAMTDEATFHDLASCRKEKRS